MIVFDRLRGLTDGGHLWARNVGRRARVRPSDSVIFVTLGFGAVLTLVGGSAMPIDVAVSLIVGQYLLKLAIAGLDTPIVYGVVALAQAETTIEPHVDPG